VDEKEKENENEGRSAWAVFETLLPSKEWAQSFSLLNYEDLCQYYEPLVLHEHIQPSTFVANVMTEIRYSARPEQLLEDINHYFDEVSGVPVVDNDFKCVGVLSKKDGSKAANAMKSRVSEVMSTPAITIFADKTVSDAAVLMLKNKIHRIPIVNNSNQVIGMVTRTDIFTALEGCVAE
jgi:predicted transcriptional regulator